MWNPIKGHYLEKESLPDISRIKRPENRRINK